MVNGFTYLQSMDFQRESQSSPNIIYTDGQRVFHHFAGISLILQWFLLFYCYCYPMSTGVIKKGVIRTKN